MTKFIEFVINHWPLWLAFVALLVLLVYEELKDKLLGIKRLSPQDLTQMINRDEAVVLDIRDKATFEQGHIIGAINIIGNELDANMARLEKYKDKALVIIDGSGQSMQVAAKLKKAGFKTYALIGGLNGWRNLGLPLTKK